mgnify:CR=1 FL=1
MATHISLALVFVEGLVSFLSPCVLPIIPIYMVIVTKKETQIKKYYYLQSALSLGYF